MLLLYASYGALPIMLLHIYHTPADRVSVPPVGLLLGVGFVEPWRAPFLLLCFFNTFLPPAYALCQPQIADLGCISVIEKRLLLAKERKPLLLIVYVACLGIVPSSGAA